jgi:hypothetical protein
MIFTPSDRDKIERVKNELRAEAAEIAKGILQRRADNRVRALARKTGLRVRCKQGRYTILGAFNDTVIIENVHEIVGAGAIPPFCLSDRFVGIRMICHRICVFPSLSSDWRFCE